MELGVRLDVSILHIDEPNPKGETYVGHEVLLTKHLEAYHLPLSKANNHLIHLEQTHYLHRELPLCKLIDVEKLVLAFYRNKVLYLIG